LGYTKWLTVSAQSESFRRMIPEASGFAFPDYPTHFQPFKETGREEVHTVEAYEKRVHGEDIEVI
jgi:hypothetical protein